MSLAELKEQASRLSPQERFDLAAFLAELDEMNEGGFQETIDRRMKAIDAGKKVTQDELEAEDVPRLNQSAGQ